MHPVSAPRRTLCGALLAVLLVAGVAPAQTPEAEREDLQKEYVTVQERLRSLQERALEDASLQAHFDSLETAVEAVMDEIDPGSAGRRERLSALEDELESAQRAGDAEKLQALLDEGVGLRNVLRETQTEALGRDGVFEEMQAFQERVVAKMTELDPETPALIELAAELASRIRGG